MAARYWGRLLGVGLSFVLLATPAVSQERGSDVQVRKVIQTALDEAFQDQVKHLFSTWMKDSTGQPQRAAAGVRRAVSAYRHAIQAIDSQKLTWHHD